MGALLLLDLLLKKTEPQEISYIEWVDIYKSDDSPTIFETIHGGFSVTHKT